MSGHARRCGALAWLEFVASAVTCAAGQESISVK